MIKLFFHLAGSSASLRVYNVKEHLNGTGANTKKPSVTSDESRNPTETIKPPTAVVSETQDQPDGIGTGGGLYKAVKRWGTFHGSRYVSNLDFYIY